MVVTWIGHATVLVQTAGLNILTDPIWSDRASPVSFAGPRRVRQPGVRFEDLPRIDLVLVSHNHYDHLDLPTLRRLWERDRPLIVTGLGNDTLMRTRGDRGDGARLGRARPGPARRRSGDGAQLSLDLALAHRPQPRALVRLRGADAVRRDLLRRRYRPRRRLLGARGGRLRPLPPRDPADRRLCAARGDAEQPSEPRRGARRLRHPPSDDGDRHALGDVPARLGGDRRAAARASPRSPAPAACRPAASSPPKSASPSASRRWRARGSSAGSTIRGRRAWPGSRRDI